MPSMTSTTTSPTFWQKTKGASGKAYRSTLKPGFDKAYNYVDKLGDPVNRLSNKVGAEAFWPTTLDRESVKAARIIRGFCKDGFYDNIDAKKAAEEENEKFEAYQKAGSKFENKPQGTQRVLKKIPSDVIKNAKGLAIYTVMRTAWVFGGSGGAGIMIARNPETGEWGGPSGIMTHCMSVGFLAGADIMDIVLVINDYKALEAFTKLRCRLGTEIGVVAGPIGVGGVADAETTTRAPVYSYVKSRGLYAGVGVEGNLVLERSDENERFYGYKLSNQEIFAGKVRHPPVDQYQILLDTLRAAEGQTVDDKLLPETGGPSDLDVDLEGHTFGVPDLDDPDPYGVKALEAEGMVIREAGSKQRPSADAFEFKPAPSSPVYGHMSRGSVDKSSKRSTWRASTFSVNSMDRGTQTDEEDLKSANHSPMIGSFKPDSPRQISPPRKIAQNVDDSETFHEVNINDDKHSNTFDRRNSLSDDDDVDSDVEIHTAVAIPAKPRIVGVAAKPPPPTLPPRNPGRVGTPSRTSIEEEHNYEETKVTGGVPGSFN